MVNWGFRGMKRSMIIDFDIEGFHHYPDAPDEVSFLEYNHRHLFQIRCGWGVEHNDREKEIFIYTDKVINWLVSKYGSPCQFGSMSCEMIAEEIILNIFPSPEWVEVFEDGKGGARVTKGD